MSYNWSSSRREGWTEAPFSKEAHEAGMQKAVLAVVTRALTFIGLWCAVAFFVASPKDSLLLIDKIMPVATLLIGYLANDAVRRVNRK